MSSAPRIVCVPLYGIGDVLMTTPALKNLKEKTGARITYLHMFRATKEILDGNPHVDDNVHFPFLEEGKLKGLRFFTGLRGKFDASINFYPSNRRDYSLAAFLIGCPTRIGHRYREGDLKEMNFLKNRTLMEEEQLHNVQENLRLLEFLGIGEPEPYPLEIHLSRGEQEAADSWLNERGLGEKLLFGFHPGTSTFKGHIKRRWPPEKFSALISDLAEQYPDAAFLIFGGPEEAPLKESVKHDSRAGQRVVAVDVPSVRDTAALIGRCKCFITNDSGLLHIAAAMQVPTVAVFGPTNPAWVSPWKCPHIVVRCGPDCQPCFRYSPTPMHCGEGQDFSCLKDIPVQQVLEAARTLLSGRTSP